MKQRAILFFFIGIMTGILQAQTLTLKDAGQLFLKQNLSLIAARYDMDIAQAQVLQARLFENPVISLEQNVYNRLNGKYFDMGKDGESGVEIEQVISIAGQRSNRIRLEKVNKEMAGYQFQEIMRTLHSELNERFVETYFLTRNMAVYEKEITSLERLLAEMKLQQQKGNISLMEASRLEAMLLSLKKERNEQENQLVAARGELNLLLSLPADARPELLLDESMLKQLDLSQLSYADLMARMTGRPDLKLARTYIRASQANLKLQKSLAFPEVSFKGTYDRAGNFINNYFAVGISFSVPIFNRNQGNIKSARIEIMKADKEKEYAMGKAEMELFTAYSQLEKAMNLYQSVDSDFEQNLEKLIAGVNETFRKRSISLLEFIDYYESYKETCIQLYDTRKDLLLAMENLNRVIGQNVFNY